MLGSQAVGGRKEEENSVNWLYSGLLGKLDLTSVQILVHIYVPRNNFLFSLTK